MFSCSQKIGKQGIKIFFIVNLTSVSETIRKPPLVKA